MNYLLLTVLGATIFSNQEHQIVGEMIDIDTGEVHEFINEEIEKIQEKISEELGFKLIDHRLELYGTKIKKKVTY